jgi:hypothetical protein
MTPRVRRCVECPKCFTIKYEPFRYGLKPGRYRDADTMSRILADDFVLVTGSGKISIAKLT